MSKRGILKQISKVSRQLRREGRLEYYLKLAGLYEQVEEFEKAESVLKEACHHFPELSSIKVSLAHVLNRLGRASEACQMLEPILQADPDNLLAARRLAESYELCGQPDKALRIYRRMLEYRFVGQEVKAQVERLERVVGQVKPEPRGEEEFIGIPTLSLARLYMEQGHYEEATKILQRILDSDPQCEECRWLLAQAKEGLNRQAAGAQVEPGGPNKPVEAVLESAVEQAEAAPVAGALPEQGALSQPEQPVAEAGGKAEEVLLFEELNRWLKQGT